MPLDRLAAGCVDGFDIQLRHDRFGRRRRRGERLAAQFFCPEDGHPLITTLHMHHEVDHVHALYLATAREAVGRVRVSVHLHRGFLIVVEGASHGPRRPGLKSVVGQDGGDGKGGFDLGNGHRRVVLFSFSFS